MKKPILNEQFADNGEHSHWELLNDIGEVIWTEPEKEEVNDFADRYEGYCSKCHKVIKTNMQGNELGTHICIPQKEVNEDVQTFEQWAGNL